MKNLMFFDVGPLGLLRCSFGWGGRALLDPFREAINNYEQIAGPLAQSVFGPVISLVLSAVLVPSI